MVLYKNKIDVKLDLVFIILGPFYKLLMTTIFKPPYLINPLSL